MADPQTDSRLMQLPQEIRDNIYEHLFRSTRFSSGKRAMGRIERCRIVSAYSATPQAIVTTGQALSILRTCRRIREEIGDKWLGLALFHFEEPEAMLNQLCRLSTQQRAKLRHVRVAGTPLMISYDDDDVFYRTCHVLKLLPGLQLDVLTVLGPADSMVSYDTLDLLIRYSDGWRELHFITHSPEFLAYEWEPVINFSLSDDPDQDEDRYARRPQPISWQKVLKDRDGERTLPSVSIYLAKTGSTRCALLEPSFREIYRQSLAEGESLEAFHEKPDAFLIRPENQQREVLVAVKRGAGVDYVEKEGSPLLKTVGDIRSDNEGQTWMQIKANRQSYYDDDDDDDEDDDEDDDDESFDHSFDDAVLVETYTDPYQYTWPPLHFGREGN